MDQTAFDLLLQQFAPDVYKLHKLGQIDTHLWEALYILLGANTEQITGEVVIHYSRGYIDEVNKNVKLLTDKASRPGYTKEQAQENS